MNCNNDFCIYNKGTMCTLESVTVNSLGMCDDCIMIRLDKEFLELEKEMQLRALNSC